MQITRLDKLYSYVERNQKNVTSKIKDEKSLFVRLKSSKKKVVVHQNIEPNGDYLMITFENGKFKKFVQKKTVKGKYKSTVISTNDEKKQISKHIIDIESAYSRLERILTDKTGQCNFQTGEIIKFVKGKNRPVSSVYIKLDKDGVMLPQYGNPKLCDEFVKKLCK